MTLVVANRISRGVRLVGDSKITNRDEILRGGVKGALKIIVLEPCLCVAFSGGVNRCLDAIRRLDRRARIAVEQRLEVADVEELLIGASQQAQGEDEFLIASLTPPALTHIRGDEVTSTHQVWIGDHNAFETYQRHFHEPTGMAARAYAETPEQEAFFEEVARSGQQLSTNPLLSQEEQEDISLAARMSDAMDDVIADPIVNTAAGFTIHMKGDERRFRYLPRAAQFGGFPQTAPLGVEIPLRFGKPASAGGYGYTYCVPDPGVGAVGVHFPQVRLGALFHPLVSDDPRLYRNVSQDEFASHVEDEYSIRLNAGFGFR